MLALSIVADSPYAGLMQHQVLKNEDDGALARRILAAAPDGDRAAEAEFCRRFAPRIRLYGLRHLRIEAAAADLVQDVLLLILQKLRSGAVREPDRLASFVLGTCRQVVIDGRRTGIRREKLLGMFAEEVTALVEEDTDALDTARLQQCLGQLPERERAVLLMTFYDDRAADAVGFELGLSAGNVRVIRHRAIERLKTFMQAAEDAQ